MEAQSQPPGHEQFWQLSKDEALSRLSCSLGGLSDAEAEKRLGRYGANTIKSTARRSAAVLFFSQFKSPVTLLLIGAALLSAGLGDVTDTIIILAIVFISSVLGFWQENGAANAVQDLLKMVQIHCTVLRDGQQKEIPVESVVPGDIICLSAGDIIPGDSLLVSAEALFVDEAAFTGETYPVEKQPDILPPDTVLAKRSNTLFMGAHVVSGKATALVFSTGKQTEFGKISGSLQLKAPETDFERGVRRFGYMLMQVTLLLVIVIFAINVLLHKPPLDSFMFSLALAVGLTPQLLPAIISVNLSAGARRMAKKQVIVKRLSSIENFGSMNILCSDKTGTVTEGRVTIRDTLDIAGAHSDKVFQYAWLNASMQQGFHNPVDKAICDAYTGAKAGFAPVAEIPYDFIRKRLTVVVDDGQGHFAITKGALNNILQICDRVETASGIEKIDAWLDKIAAQYGQLGNSGFRTLGIAYKPVAAGSRFTRDDERQMIFAGYIVLFDPPKKNIRATIDNLHSLGVKLKIITGDNALVARSVAVQMGIAQPAVLTGAEISKLSFSALIHKAVHTDIFAEVEPNQKERIISLLKRSGNVVGFMGDGINDAPALHVADVGISVDTAVDVAKEAADIVLLSQSLDVLNEGIVEGRKTFTNTMKYIFMATSANFGNMFSMAGASLLMPFLPLLPKQILLTNLLTDFPEMAIATDRVEPKNIKTPQKWNLRFIRRFMVVFGLLSSIFDYLTFGVLLFLMHAREKVFQTGWFTESVVSAVFIVLVVRTRSPFFKSPPGKLLLYATLLVFTFVLLIPLLPVSGWFGFTPLPAIFYLWMAGIVAMYLLSAELAKKWFYKKQAKVKP